MYSYSNLARFLSRLQYTLADEAKSSLFLFRRSAVSEVNQSAMACLPIRICKYVNGNLKTEVNQSLLIDTVVPVNSSNDTHIFIESLYKTSDEYLV